MEAAADSVRSESWLPLPKIGRGQKVRVQKLEGHESVCNRLREMGFCELSEVKILNNSGAMLCQVCGTKVCLSRQVADSILVEPSTCC
ncbi:MAG: ferrous iron transport protein A [Verrucomicrobiota bacterium]